MKKQRQVEESGLIVTHFCGLHTYADAAEALDELLEINKGSRQIYEMVINEDDIELSFTRKEEKLLIEKVGSTYEKFDRGALAVVANQDLVFGLSRMLATAIENERIAISVFRSEELARRWIQEMRELHRG